MEQTTPEVQIIFNLSDSESSLPESARNDPQLQPYFPSQGEIGGQLRQRWPRCSSCIYYFMERLHECQKYFHQGLTFQIKLALKNITLV